MKLKAFQDRVAFLDNGKKYCAISSDGTTDGIFLEKSEWIEIAENMTYDYGVGDFDHFLSNDDYNELVDR